MKKILLILVLIVTAISTYAQYPEYGIGVRGGLDWGFMFFNPNVNQSKLPMTFHGGLQFRMVSEKYFGLKLELNYEQRGFKDIDGHRRFDYIELPIMSHLTFGNKFFKFFIDLGPTISVMINEKKINAESAQHSLPIKNRFDYGLVGGIGFEFNTKYGIYTIDGRYNFGLGNVFKSSAADVFKMSSNQNISVSLAYLFPIRP